MTDRNIFKRNLRQTAVYWGSPDQDEYGDIGLAASTEIKCRWEAKQQLFVDDKGQEATSVAVVFTSSELAVEGELMLGTSDDVESNDKPSAGFTRYKIRAIESMPSKSNRVTIYKCWLGLVRMA